MTCSTFTKFVKELQATDSFAVILSEARKYGLNLTVANQYVAQMTDSVRDAVFGNVGTTISFRVSADDAPVLTKQFEPTFDESDLLQLNNRHFVISMIINGEKVPAFSATTLSIPATPADNFEAIVAHSREYFARPRMEVEAEIRATIEQSEKYKRELSDSGRQEGTTEPKLVINSKDEKPVFRLIPQPESKPMRSTEQKPNYKVTTPQADLRRSGMSPNAAEGKERLGLKDLARLAAEQSGSKVEFKKTEPKKDAPTKKGKVNPKKKGKKDHRKKSVTSVNSSANHTSNQPNNSHITPDKPIHSDQQNDQVATDKAIHLASEKQSFPTPVTPEVEYQEKSTVVIRPSHDKLPLSTPVKRTENFADKDNSVDGFLSIKH